MTREQLVHIARRGVEHFRNGTQDQVDDVYTVPVGNYIDGDRWQREMDRIFKRVPLVVGASSELAQPGSYHALDVAGIPVLVVRGDDGELRAFVNMCSHRGAIVVEDGIGSARRHACPYHAWTYNTRGALVGVLDADDFGDIDRSLLGLTPLACAERAGLVWVYLTDEPAVDIDTFLCGYGEMLEHLDFDSCHVAGRQRLPGPNWKVAYDGYLDYYHLPILHRDSFGPDYSNKAIYSWWGPHQRVTAPDRHFEPLSTKPEDDWETDELIGGVWTIFPHVSIASFDAGGKVYMVSQLYPGAEPGSSMTTQMFLHTEPRSDEVAKAVEDRMDFLHHVVNDEDYYTGLRIQKALATGAKPVNMFGRNEGGGQRFHRFVDALLEVDDADLEAFFKEVGESWE
jgi:phenylpropionate dioxygenase-like ring-hydroxylating dioxygenase large terminal subunit